MRTAAFLLGCALALGACGTGSIATDAIASAAPSVAEPTVAESDTPTTEPSAAEASVAPPESHDPATCMDARARDLLLDPGTDWETVPQADREFVAAALEAYAFDGAGAYDQLVQRLREPGAALGELAPMRLYSGEITIESCG